MPKLATFLIKKSSFELLFTIKNLPCGLCMHFYSIDHKQELEQGRGGAQIIEGR
jgi:hypothetical protein